MKKFEKPIIEIYKFAVDDIITTSAEGSIDFPVTPAGIPKVNETDLTNIG